MKQKLRKILFSFVLMFGLVISVNAETKIKEDASKYNGDVYIIGSSKFDSDIIVTGTMAGRAGAREAYVQYFLYDNYDFDADDLTIYYFSGLDETWYMLPSTSEEEFRELEEEEVEKLTENLNIYYVNGEEKVFEVPYEVALEEGYELVFDTDNDSRNSEIKYEDGKLIIPATIKNVKISAKNENTEYVLDEIEQVDTELKVNFVVVKTEEELKSALSLNDIKKIMLGADIELTKGINVDRELTLDLNGKTLSSSDKLASTSLITVLENGKLAIEGKGTINSASQGNDYSMAVWAYKGGEVVIYNGTFTNVGGKALEDNGITPNNNELIYAYNGIITIYGGTFIGNSENRTFGTRYTLNKRDNDSSNIIVKGGTFVGYNPEKSLSENPQANFVAEGYAVSLVDGNYVVVAVDEDDVAISEGVAYKTLSDAVVNAKAKSTIKVLKNINIDDEVIVDRELTLDLNGKTLSTADTFTKVTLIRVIKNGKLTINGEGKVNSAGKANDYAIAVWAREGEVIINGGTFTNLGGKDYEDMENLIGGNNNELIYAYNGKITINGGTFIGNSDNRYCGTRYTLNKNDADNSIILVYGGTFVGYNPAKSLSENPQANFVADGYKVTESNGEYTVKALEETDVAISEGSAYKTLNEAVANAKAKSTIKVLKNINIDDEVVVEKELTIDFNGKTLSPSATMTDDELITVNASGKLTVEGNGNFEAARQNNDYSTAIWANGGELIIKNGTFTNLGGKSFEDNGTTPNNNELIYVSNGGKATIYDGRFTGNYTNPTHKGRYTLNLKDNSGSSIIVYGGTYIEFNPSKSLSENPQANFVADGYKVDEKEINGIREYKVIAE